MKKLFIFISSLLIQTKAMADTEALTESMKQTLRHSASGIPSVTHVVISTLVMVVMIYVVAIIYQHLNHFNKKKFGGAEDKTFIPNRLKIVNTLVLGNNKSVYVVEVNDKYLVLGSTQSSLSLIKEFDKSQINKLIENSSASTVGKVVPEVIEQELKTLFPKQEVVVEEIKPTPEVSVVKNDRNFEEIYKKYI